MVRRRRLNLLLVVLLLLMHADVDEEVAIATST
jgi:hypothetical protein